MPTSKSQNDDAPEIKKPLPPSLTCMPEAFGFTEEYMDELEMEMEKDKKRSATSKEKSKIVYI